MNNTESTVQNFLEFLGKRDLEKLTRLFSDEIDWYIPGDEDKAAWLGQRKNRQEISDFFQLLWQHTEPVSAQVDHIFIDGEKAVVAGEFSTKMLPTGKVVDSLFFIQMTVKNGVIRKYRLLEDSHAVSVALS